MQTEYTLTRVEREANICIKQKTKNNDLQVTVKPPSSFICESCVQSNRENIQI